MMLFRDVTTIGFAGLLLLVAGCADETVPPVTGVRGGDRGPDSSDLPVQQPTAAPMSGKGDMPAPEEIVFRDEVTSNTQVPVGLDGLLFVDTNGNRVALEDYLGLRNVILVFTEGFAGMLCPFCTTQTSRLVANYDRFAELETEILVVYPGERDHLDEFLEAARTTGQAQVSRVPFPIVLDEKMEAVDYFEIRSSLAHPSTYVIDKQGDVQLAYVGADMSADRPSVNALLELVRSIGSEGAE